MTITYYNELALFTQEIDYKEGTLTVRYAQPSPKGGVNGHVTNGDVGADTLTIPLEPDLDAMNSNGETKQIDVNMHQSPTKAYLMSEECNEWFSGKLGWRTILAYLGPHRRKVLGNIAPGASDASDDHAISTGKDVKNNGATTNPPGLVSKLWQWGSTGGWSGRQNEDAITKESTSDPLTFADIAPYLVVTEESLAQVSERLPDGVEMDITKFRPNIVLQGAEQAWEEDFWGGIKLTTEAARTSTSDEQASKGGRMAEILLTSNCGRCVSINVDYDTGRACAGEDGTILKKLMRDRRVDVGNKWSPIFGRYGFLNTEEDAEEERELWVEIGSKVAVSRVNKARTTFRKLFRAVGVKKKLTEIL